MPLKLGEKICTRLVNDMRISSQEALCGDVEKGRAHRTSTIEQAAQTSHVAFLRYTDCINGSELPAGGIFKVVTPTQ